jgi:hypothetical protein
VRFRCWSGSIPAGLDLDFLGTAAPLTTVWRNSSPLTAMKPPPRFGSVVFYYRLVAKKSRTDHFQWLV